MQAANVQMRILTEDSLTQLENMQSVADNIANLTHLVQPIVAKNYHDLLEFSEKGKERGAGALQSALLHSQGVLSLVLESVYVSRLAECTV